MKQHKALNLLKLREDAVINIDNIDIVVKTNKDPKDKSELVRDIYVVYLRNSKYNWIVLTEEEYIKNVKPYIINLKTV